MCRCIKQRIYDEHAAAHLPDSRSPCCQQPMFESTLTPYMLATPALHRTTATSVLHAVQGWAELQQKSSQKCEIGLEQLCQRVLLLCLKQLQQAVAQHGAAEGTIAEAAEGCWIAGILCCRACLQT